MSPDRVPPESGRDFRVHWTHANGRDRMVGDWWDRESAEHIATMLRRSEWCRDVEVRRAASLDSGGER